MKKLIIGIAAVAVAILVPQGDAVRAADRPCWHCEIDIVNEEAYCPRAGAFEAGWLNCQAINGTVTYGCNTPDFDCGIDESLVSLAGTLINRGGVSPVLNRVVSNDRLWMVHPCNGAVVSRTYDPAALARVRKATASLSL